MCLDPADDPQSGIQMFQMLISLLLSVFQSAAVQRVFLNQLTEVARAWHVKLPELPAAASRFLRCSVHAIKNTRRKMEDKHVALAHFNQLFGLQVRERSQR